MTRVKMNHKTVTILAVIATIAATLLAAGTVAIGSDNSAFAHHKKGYYKAYRGNSFRGISERSDMPQQILCLTAGGNSPITTACSNTATSADDNTGGVIGLGYHNGRHGISQQSNIPQNAICLTAGGNSPISTACNDKTTATQSNTGGILGTSGR